MRVIAYIAFLRGINVGGNVLISMADLKKVFEKTGFTNVRTMLASGNVLFESENPSGNKLALSIESVLKKTLKKNINVIVRNIDYLDKLRSQGPFGGINVTPDTRLYVTFLPEKSGPRTITLPYSSSKGEFRILSASATEVMSVLDLSKGKGTTDLMAVLEKEFGTDITTRNWNTILKVLG